MAVFTDGELEFLLSQRLARLATASKVGQPDVSAVGFAVSDDTIVSGGIDLTKTIRYRHLLENPQATIVIDDLVSVDPWRPRGVKVRGPATLEDDGGHPRIRIRPHVVWSWGINTGPRSASPLSNGGSSPDIRAPQPLEWLTGPRTELRSGDSPERMPPPRTPAAPYPAPGLRCANRPSNTAAPAPSGSKHLVAE